MGTTPTPTRKIAVFLTLTFGLSSVFYLLIIAHGGMRGAGIYVLGLMWCPGLSALLTQLYFHRSLRGLGWGWGKTRFQVASYLLPLAYAACVYVPVWLFGLGELNGENLRKMAEAAGLGSLPGLLGVGLILLISATLGVVGGAVSALGEEIGWRGLLVPELGRLTKFTNTALLSGSIWALWHFPLILFADYRSETPVWYAILCFTVMVVGLSFPLAWLRLRSGSVWTAMFLHASHNVFIQGIFDGLTTDLGPTEWIIGEFGAGLAIVTAVLGYLFWRMRERALPPGCSQESLEAPDEPGEDPRK